MSACQLGMDWRVGRMFLDAVELVELFTFEIEEARETLELVRISLSGFREVSD